jgi:hypothetical protein
MAKVLGIGGIFIRSTDPGQLYRWYEEHLGLTRGPSECVIFPWRHPDHKEGMNVWSLFPRDSAYFPASQAVMVNYIVDDLDGAPDPPRGRGDRR